jgi:microcompartment protein CcmL/EutN
MKQALGLVEIQGLSTAVLVADTMVKAANVTILEIENSKGQGYMTVKIAGDVGAVNAAVSAGKQTGLENQKLVSFKVIARPADSVDQIFGAAKNTKTDASSQQSDSSAEVQTQTEKEDVIAGETSVNEAIKETVKPEVQLEEKLEEKPALVEQAEEEKPAQEPQAELQTEPQVESQTEPEKASSANPSGAKKTAGHKNKK